MYPVLLVALWLFCPCNVAIMCCYLAVAFLSLLSPVTQKKDLLAQWRKQRTQDLTWLQSPCS